MSLHLDSATQAAASIHKGEYSSEDLVADCLERIAATDGAIKAWVHLDAEAALEQARALDILRQDGRPLGPLHGLPVGVKDIFDTSDMPTAYGSPIYQGRQPAADSTVVAKLREVGAVIMGKTVSAELAFVTPGETTNPFDPSRTPGGSSSGSAAAVAAAQVPLAVGSQTNGSVVRPASFCGTFGFKPSRGMISRQGVLQTSETLDQIGGFGRTLEDVALLCDALTGFDAADGATYPRAKPDFSAGCRQEVPVEPALAWLDLPFYDRLAEDAGSGIAELRDALGGRVEEFTAPDSLANIVDHHQVIHEYEVRRNLAEAYERRPQDISPELLLRIERGGSHSDEEYSGALAALADADAFFAEFFHDFDAILAPSAAGEAPEGLAWTGDPIFCTIWTFCGLPSLSLPLLVGENGLPIGVQLVSGLEEDARLCRTAQWLLDFLQDN
ncbi:MAG: amidase [Alphaproteobacteria bacterium]|jgi:Asp-tRNA(Asn)/Glu-tRNA(Gln) amidotransferase A subunit family amidase|nr:glutamyl-tRNA amidotransferase [Rhodospirillaceae bacterium]MDP6406556.1 amidase [Alphaproteobacteria bacterium]